MLEQLPPKRGWRSFLLSHPFAMKLRMGEARQLLEGVQGASIERAHQECAAHGS